MKILIITKQGEIKTIRNVIKIEFANINEENKWNNIEITYIKNPCIKRGIYPIEQIKALEVIEEKKNDSNSKL